LLKFSFFIFQILLENRPKDTDFGKKLIEEENVGISALLILKKMPTLRLLNLTRTPDSFDGQYL